MAAVARPDSGPFFARFHAALSRSPRSPTVLFSGGLDSSLIVLCLTHLGRSPSAFTIGLPGAPDLAAATSAAAELGVPLESRLVGPDEVAATLDDPGLGVRAARPSDVPVRAALSIALQGSPSDALICGQGADELFGGYSHFRDLPPEAAEQRRLDDLHRLRHREWPWTLEAARRRGRRLFAPYLDWEVVGLVLGLHGAEWYDPSVPKAWLRSAAEEHGLPSEIARRPKRAFQYGSRIAREVSRTSGPAPSPRSIDR